MDWYRLNKDTLQELLRLSLPMVISQGAFAVMIFTDRYFMSQIEPIMMAAALGGGVASFFSISLFIGLLSYANALVAQYFGAGEKHKCARVVTQGLIITVLSMPILILVTYFVGKLFAAMDHDPRQVELESIYYYLLMVSCFLPLSKLCIASYFSGIGRTKVVMICDVLGMMMNVPISYMLIFGKFGLPALGIAGAAIGTIISSAFSLVLFLMFYFEENNRRLYRVMDSFRFDKAIMRRYIRLGLPSGLEMFLNVAAFNLFLLMFQSYGIAEAAAAAIVFNWDILAFVPMLGLNIGVISLTGRFVGANNMEKTNEVIISGFLIALGYTGILAIVFIIFRLPMVEIFVSPGKDYQEIIEITSFMMIGLATYVMADAARLVSSAVLRGAGDTRWLMISSVTLYWTMLLAQYLIIRVFELGPKISWLAFVVMIFAITVICLMRLKGGKWRHPERLERVMAE
jgi:multidrug resistance protein, MATE family